jgi:hypothetical protein
MVCITPAFTAHMASFQTLNHAVGEEEAKSNCLIISNSMAKSLGQRPEFSAEGKGNYN